MLISVPIIIRSERDEDGEGEDCDQADRQLDEPAGHLLQEEERAAEEGQGALHPLRCGGRPHHLLKHRQTLRVLQHQVGSVVSEFSLLSTDLSNLLYMYTPLMAIVAS